MISVVKQNKRTAPRTTSSLGVAGESLAAEFLAQSGLRLVFANFRAPIGRNTKGVQVDGEIDLIALDGETLCFIEVKTRRSAAFTPILTNVDRRKQRQIIRVARVYRKIFALRDIRCRFDVVTILMPEGKEAEILHFKGYWHESKFRKRNWDHEPGQHYY